MLYFVGIIISFFLALLIFSKKERQLADLILGTWMVIIGLHLMMFYSTINGTIFEYSHIMGIGLILPFLHGPSLYLYTLSITNPAKINWIRVFLHSIIPIFVLLGISPFFLLSHSEQEYVMRHKGVGHETLIFTMNIVLTISGIGYVFFTNLLLRKHKKRISDQFSNQEKINLNWLRFLFYGMAVIWILIIFYSDDRYIFTLATLFVICIGYYGIRQVGIFTNPKTLEVLAENELLEEVVNFTTVYSKKKYAKSGLSEETANELRSKLTLLMANDKLYLEPELTLVDLASRLGTHPNYLSQVINDLENVNFYDYVNGLRAQEFKEKVSNPENKKFTLIAIAYECGFNSKSAFNRFFKKIEGLSPSEYIKSKNY